jgi:hypothetical protein
MVLTDKCKECGSYIKKDDLDFLIIDTNDPDDPHFYEVCPFCFHAIYEFVSDGNNNFTWEIIN